MTQASTLRFGNFPAAFCTFSRSEAAILPVPFDQTSLWHDGAVLGPAAILEASRRLEGFDVDTRTEVYRRGIFTAEPLLADTAVELVSRVRGQVRHLRASGKLVVTLGGEHTVSLGAIRALTEELGHISILHLDAHADARAVCQGSAYHRGCVMARARELGARVVSVGTRSMDLSEYENVSFENLFTPEIIRQRGDWIEQVLRRLSEPVYVSIDLDVFDPAIMPCTDRPEPGGLDWYAVTALLREVALRRRVAGFDVVGLRPSGHSASDLLAAKLVYAFLSSIFAVGAP